MKKYFFAAFAALVLCSCNGNLKNSESSSFSRKDTEEMCEGRDEGEQYRGSKIYRAKVVRVKQIIERLLGNSVSATVLLLDNGDVFSMRDEYNESLCLLREGDEVEYTRRSDGKIERIVRCNYQQVKASEE